MINNHKLGTMVQSRSAIEHLKRNWFNNPCWDIEDTEGFETHYIELKAFRIGCELYWDSTRAKAKALRNKKIEVTAKEFDCSFALANYITKLETEIDQLANRIMDLEDQYGIAAMVAPL